ncbi:anthranilate phosphoribosyltransferase [Histoplasma capsulatum G186AR]|uniref:Anthranilate phosphoribosyltransferase n=2 Tax=Ajellomyces capsulatus TaxID=5037 RepID=C0NJM9_AJECG|nr:anthranilate phosphoribosyltransferase [Histoplasma capsulatum G186AR]EEH08070.1 anthranilate phosphoribosyltransferase [Histoplasma capsulatum G186AR]KAG5299604.1 anthranilate phosphoribosyltransferase [Histoplasma capsulatum]QSS67770.1 anthranilate phosphoribosyltransferase [Histoplasma capsulatum G186AR]
MASDKQDFSISISPLLTRLAYPDAAPYEVTAGEIAGAFSLIFENKLSLIQTAAFLTLLHSTGKDRDADVLAQCAARMREAAEPIERAPLLALAKERDRKEGSYNGGFCDIVGTGGDSHRTFNISTTSSIIASPLLMIAKHGNRAQTSFSGSADVLTSITPNPPNLSAVRPENVFKVYEKSNYCFFFAPNFHTGMKFATPVRKGLGLRTIFNLLGPLANPIDWGIEARLVGVAYKSLGPIFANVLKLSGVKRALVVCGEEDLDEISCAGKTNCWKLSEYLNPEYQGGSDSNPEDDEALDEDAPSKTLVKIEHFQLQPSDFGFSTRPLSEVGGGKMPSENALILMSMLRNEMPRDHPILEFVLMNVAALLVISGICDADTSNMGPGDNGEVIKEVGPGGGRWKEGIRRARWAIESGRALSSLEKFIEVSNSL